MIQVNSIGPMIGNFYIQIGILIGLLELIMFVDSLMPKTAFGILPIVVHKMILFVKYQKVKKI